MSEWITNSIEPELCDIIAGGTPPTENKEYWNGDILWITPADMSRLGRRFISESERRITSKGVKYSTGKLMPTNSVIISCRAPVGYCVMATEPFTTNQGCKTLLCKKIEPGYLYYYLLGSTAQLMKVSSGTTFLELSKKELGRFQVSFPVNVQIQREIVKILESIDAVIDKTRDTLNKYRDVKKGLLQDFFHDGEIVSLSDKRYFALNPSTRKLPPAFYYVDLESVVDGMLLVLKPEERASAPSRAQRLLQKNDILFQMVRPYQQNNLFFTLEADLPFVASTGYAQIRTNQNPIYVYYALHTFDFVSDVNRRCTGSNYPAINSTELSKVQFRLPNRKVQDEIASYMTAIDKTIQDELVNLDKFENVKIGLVKDLLSGKREISYVN